jgi:chorismate mutase
MASDNSPPRCIRMLLHLETAKPRNELKHVFLRGATVLRPELTAPGDEAL